MKAPDQLGRTVAKRLDETWHDDATIDTAWPYTIGLAVPAGRALEEQFAQVHAWAANVRNWAIRHGVELHWEIRSVVRTPQRLPVKATIPNQDTAATVAGPPWPDVARRHRDRAALLRDRFPDTASPKLVRTVARLGDTDLAVLCAAATWFRENDGSGYTPRQVPVPGMHSKWLSGETTRRSTCRQGRPRPGRPPQADPALLLRPATWTSPLRRHYRTRSRLTSAHGRGSCDRRKQGHGLTLPPDHGRTRDPRVHRHRRHAARLVRSLGQHRA